VNPKRSQGNEYIEWSEECSASGGVGEMDLSRAVYGRDLKIAAMRAFDAGATTGEIARKYQVSPLFARTLAGE